MTRSRKPETILRIERGQVRKSSVARPVPAPSPQIPASTLPSPPVAWRAARRPPESNVDVETACVLIGSWELKCECASAVNSAYNHDHPRDDGGDPRRLYRGASRTGARIA